MSYIKQRDEVISAIHKSQIKFVIVSSGGGSEAISALLKVPGASNSVLEAHIPYARESSDYYLLRKPDSYCSQDTSLRIAAKAYSAAKKIAPKINHDDLFGVGITASLSTKKKKRGNHRFHIALHTRKFSRFLSVNLKKGLRTRSEEEDLLSSFIVSELSKISGGHYEPQPLTEEVSAETIYADDPWIDLVDERINFVSSSKQKPKVVFPGAFNPVHSGHRKMEKIAKDMTGSKVYFEVCIQNVDKPPMSYKHVKDTLDQFEQSDCWVLTKAGKFPEKAEIFKGCTFVIGADTLLRMFDERFYASKNEMHREFEIFNENDNNFLVFGREYQGKFYTLEDISIPKHIITRFQGLNKTQFSDSSSSSNIRKEKSE